MAVRRLVAKASLEALTQQFAAIRAREGVVETYADEVVADAVASHREEDGDHVVGERVDLTDLPLVTVDPAGSRDLDQALHLARHGGGWRVRYAIADVGAHVVPGGALDADTRARGETVYCPDTRVGLHPPLMSEGYASLLAGQRSKAVVWELDVDAAGDLVAAHAQRAWVMSRRQYAYTALAAARTSEDAQLVAALRDFGDLRRAHLRERGAVTLPKPSQEVVADAHGVTVEFRGGTRIEDDNAQVSLLTGFAAAQMMMRAKVGIVRTMPAATPDALDRLRRQARALGIAWAHGESYADVLDRVDPESPDGAAFLVQAVTLFRGAQWEPFDLSTERARSGLAALPLPTDPRHGALAAPYAHVTAPLRRLVDRFGLEICLAASDSRPVPAWVTRDLEAVPRQLLAGVRRSAAVDRSCVDAVEAAVLSPHVGEVFSGIGLDARTVQLAAPAVVARCSGEVAVGREMRVRLVSAELDQGPQFEAV